MQTFNQQVHLEEVIDSNGTEGSWAWRDERDFLSSPKGPGPCCAAARKSHNPFSYAARRAARSVRLLSISVLNSLSRWARLTAASHAFLSVTTTSQ